MAGLLYNGGSALQWSDLLYLTDLLYVTGISSIMAESSLHLRISSAFYKLYFRIRVGKI
jgi:hypothetical protein